MENAREYISIWSLLKHKAYNYSPYYKKITKCWLSIVLKCHVPPFKHTVVLSLFMLSAWKILICKQCTPRSANSRRGSLIKVCNLCQLGDHLVPKYLWQKQADPLISTSSFQKFSTKRVYEMNTSCTNADLPRQGSPELNPRCVWFRVHQYKLPCMNFTGTFLCTWRC